jgi:hypothetical protein
LRIYSTSSSAFIRIDSKLDSSNSCFLNISSSTSASLIPLEESSKAFVTYTRHSIRARIQAVTLLDKNVLHYKITT